MCLKISTFESILCLMVGYVAIYIPWKNHNILILVFYILLIYGVYGTYKGYNVPYKYVWTLISKCRRYQYVSMSVLEKQKLWRQQRVKYTSEFHVSNGFIGSFKLSIQPRSISTSVFKIDMELITNHSSNPCRQ